MTHDWDPFDPEMLDDPLEKHAQLRPFHSLIALGNRLGRSGVIFLGIVLEGDAARRGVVAACADLPPSRMASSSRDDIGFQFSCVLPGVQLDWRGDCWWGSPFNRAA
jgi:hypothetical protein